MSDFSYVLFFLYKYFFYIIRSNVFVPAYLAGAAAILERDVTEPCDALAEEREISTPCARSCGQARAARWRHAAMLYRSEKNGCPRAPAWIGRESDDVKENVRL